ncbi:MAG: NTPase [Methanomassiliicoccales archaeon]
MTKNVMITGPPGVGKTTVLIRAARSIEGADGFYTEEMKEEGSRVGFRIVSLSGERGVLSHKDLEGEHRVGKYTVDLDTLEEIGVESIRRALEGGGPVIIDEIGKMELLSPSFKGWVERALESPCSVLATIKAGRDTFCDAIKAREDVTLVNVTRENRDSMPSRLLDLIG